MSIATARSWLQRERSVWLYVVVMLLASAWLIAKDAGGDFIRFWDFRVYLKAKEVLLETGSPYFDRESLRFIYPPTAIPFLHLLNDTHGFQSAYFVGIGALWFGTAALFCRRNVHLIVVFPVFLLVFGKHGYVTVLTGNIGPAMYFVAALAMLQFLRGKLSVIVFSLIILLLTLIKPFYAEFLIAIWFVAGFLTFLKASVAVTGLFFAVNLVFYPNLFFEFLSALKVGEHDTEIFGITMLSHLVSLNVPELLAVTLHFGLVGFLVLLIAQRFSGMSSIAQFCGVFILAVLINPKHVTYDLLVLVPPLVVVLLEGRRWVSLLGLGILFVASYVNFELAPKPYYQWWYACVIAFLISMLALRPTASLASFSSWLWSPSRN